MVLTMQFQLRLVIIFANHFQTCSYTILLELLPAAPHVMAMQHNISSSLSTLTCTSTGSPPTNVTWMKDGETLITNGTTYSLTQTLVDRVNSTYKNTLTIEANVEYVVGEYSCKVANSIGTSNLQETEIKGKKPQNKTNLRRLKWICVFF